MLNKKRMFAYNGFKGGNRCAYAYSEFYAAEQNFGDDLHERKW